MAERMCSDYDIDDENREVITMLLKYFTGNPAFESEPELRNPSLRKGILLAGNVGSGKTLLLDILRACHFPGQSFGRQTCRQVAQRYASEGFKEIEMFGAKAVRFEHGKKKCSHLFFDDLGAEGDMSFFGNKQNVMAEVLIDRYEHFLKNGLITHLTTNLDLDGIEQEYGNRLLSRMHQMFNFIPLGAHENSTDRRKKRLKVSA